MLSPSGAASEPSVSGEPQMKVLPKVHTTVAPGSVVKVKVTLELDTVALSAGPPVMVSVGALELAEMVFAFVFVCVVVAVVVAVELVVVLC